MLIIYPGEGTGNPLQYSCLENPVDGGAWWAVVHRVARSRARLEWLSMCAWVSYIPVVPFLCIKPREHVFLYKDFYIASLFHNRWKLNTTQIFINAPWITNWGVSYNGILFSRRKNVLLYEQLGWIHKELEKKIPTKKNTLWFHLYDILERAKYRDRHHMNDWQGLGDGETARNWE